MAGTRDPRRLCARARGVGLRAPVRGLLPPASRASPPPDPAAPLAGPAPSPIPRLLHPKPQTLGAAPQMLSLARQAEAAAARERELQERLLAATAGQAKASWPWLPLFQDPRRCFGGGRIACSVRVAALRERRGPRSSEAAAGAARAGGLPPACCLWGAACCVRCLRRATGAPLASGQRPSGKPLIRPAAATSFPRLCPAPRPPPSCRSRSSSCRRRAPRPPRSAAAPTRSRRPAPARPPTARRCARSWPRCGGPWWR
jgi:hypothetical protein